MRKHKIQTNINLGDKIITDEFELTGWVDGRQSFLWFGNSKSCFATYGGRQLYLLCKKIVNSYESEKAGQISQ